MVGVTLHQRNQTVKPKKMFDIENRTQIKRIPRQQRSQVRFETVLQSALRLFAARGYESVSMREIARDAKMPIASVYQYFATKLAIVREMWGRYTFTISQSLEDAIHRFSREDQSDFSHLIGTIVDRMAELQASNPSFIEIWSCVAASIELRALNTEDTLQNARAVARALQAKYPKSDPSVVYDRALIAIEMASATTRFALALPEPHRARTLLSLKDAIAVLLESALADTKKPSNRAKKKGRSPSSVRSKKLS